MKKLLIFLFALILTTQQGFCNSLYEYSSFDNVSNQLKNNLLLNQKENSIPKTIPSSKYKENKEIYIYNLREKNIYILNLGYRAEKIDISDTNILNITPVTSISSDNEKVIIETLKNGVCDVLINSKNKIYKYRFISGDIFQDEKEELIELDIPPIISSANP